MKQTVTSMFLVAAIALFNCSACVEDKSQPGQMQHYQGFLRNSDMSEKALVEHITRRTVRVIIRCTIYNNKTHKVYKNKKNYDAGWGTGAIIYSSSDYSLIQTARHVAVNKDVTQGDLTRKCTGFKIERRNTNNEIVDTVAGKITVVALDANYDVAVLRVPYNFRVNSRIAYHISLGQSIRVVGFPSNRFFTKRANIAYERGYVGTINAGGTKVRWAVAAYFGNSGGAVWNQKGEIVGTVVSIGGFQTLLGSYIPQQNYAFGPPAEALRKFYANKKIQVMLK